MLKITKRLFSHEEMETLSNFLKVVILIEYPANFSRQERIVSDRGKTWLVKCCSRDGQIQNDL